MARRRKGNTDSQYYYKWLEKALSDLQSARILLTWGGDEMAVAFHCQQAIEKALKGYLLFKLGRHFDGHNLTFLCRQLLAVPGLVVGEQVKLFRFCLGWDGCLVYDMVGNDVQTPDEQVHIHNAVIEL